MVRRLPLLLTLAFGVAACDDERTFAPDAVNPDPRMDAVLFLPIMVDPDLSQQNRRNVAVEPGGPVDASMPGAFPKPAPKTASGR